MTALAGEHRFEEAADVRERAAALSAALERQRRLDRLRRAGRLAIALGEGGAELVGGRLVASWAGDQRPLPGLEPEVDPTAPVGRDEVDELLCVSRWLDERAGQVRITHCDGGLASLLPQLPRFTPGRRRRAGVA
jgi:hypothetical protein